MPSLRRLLAPALLFAASRSAVAQSIAMPTDTGVVAWSALTERPRLQDTSKVAHVRFPSMLASAHVGGEVHLEMIVGRDGVPERSSLRVVTSAHDLFTSSIKSAIVDWRFTPAMVDGREVRTIVPVFVSFLMEPKDQPWRVVGIVVADSSGVHISLGREAIPRQVGLASNRADSSAAMIAVFAELFSTARLMKSSAMCVTSGDSRRAVLTDVLHGVRTMYPDARDPAHCTPTYTSMIQEVDSLGKPIRPPKGALDPVWLSTSKVQLWTSDLFMMTGSVAQGTATSRYQCQAWRSGLEWRATCELTSMTVSFSAAVYVDHIALR
jgi:hypothetical protein